MAKFLVKRLLYIILVLFIMSIILFIIQINVPGNPALQFIEGNMADFQSEAEWQLAYQAARDMLGLDDNYLVQYSRWVTNILRGDLGQSSLFRRPVAEVIGAPMQNTLILNIFNLILVFMITIPIGIRAAVRRGKAFDQGVQVATTIGMSMPLFLFAILILIVFSVFTGWFPMGGTATAGADYTGFAHLADRARHIFLPLLTMVLTSMAGMTRFVRAAMAEALTNDYVRTARAKGLSEKVVIYSHAFRNALVPIITVMTGWFMGIFGGTVMIERIFSFNGMGQVMINSLEALDFQLFMTMNLFFIVVSLGALLLMDIAYALADPRVRVG